MQKGGKGLLSPERRLNLLSPLLQTMGLLPLFLAVLIVFTVLYFGGWITRAEVQNLGAFVRKSSGALIVFGMAFLLTRNIGIAVFCAMLAYSYFSRKSWFPGAAGGASGNISSIRTTYLEMSLDRRSGAMSGRVLLGKFAGRALSELTMRERLDLLSELRSKDSQGAQLLEAFLDRTAPGWNGKTPPGGRGMSLEEAYLVLGLGAGATRQDVQAAHRNLMKRFHPDQGGSTYIASKVNEAKDVLLKHIAA